MLALAGRLPAERGVPRSREDRARGEIIEALLCRGEADAGVFADAAQGQLERYREKGLIRWAGTQLFLVPEARPYARTIAAAFDSWRQPDTRRFSNAV